MLERKVLKIELLDELFGRRLRQRATGYCIHLINLTKKQEQLKVQLTKYLTKDIAQSTLCRHPARTHLT